MRHKKKQIGKFLSLILRHNPDVVGIELDKNGWADVDELVRGIQKTRDFSRKELEEIVRTDEKMRYSFNEDGTKIRANQGHSVRVDLGLQPLEPPEVLWHGSARRFHDGIMESGLLPKSRLQVHLSSDYATAVKVGARHGEPIVYQVLSGRMHQDGYLFYLSSNGVWLTDHVPAAYLHLATSEASGGTQE